jgi:hypothetical protein
MATTVSDSDSDSDRERLAVKIWYQELAGTKVW